MNHSTPINGSYGEIYFGGEKLGTTRSYQATIEQERRRVNTQGQMIIYSDEITSIQPTQDNQWKITFKHGWVEGEVIISDEQLRKMNIDKIKKSIHQKLVSNHPHK